MNKPITIIGAGGSIANCLVPLITEKNEPLRLLSRSGYSINGADCRKVDVSNQKELSIAIKDSKVVILLVGIEYTTAQWQIQWPKIMDNCITACIENNVPFIFFDNVYMYGQVDGIMTESTPFNPCSKKGEIRATIASHLLQQIKKNNIRASIARAADFYGPHAEEKSFFHQMVLKNLREGKKAQWMVNAKVPHSFSYTHDMAKGLYLLAHDENTLNQTWHMPTAIPALTGEEMIALAANLMGQNNKYMSLSKWMIKSFGWFNKVVGESVEMLYQYEHPYHFSSEKFEKHFNFKPTSYEQGLRETNLFYKK
jgi:nucleoside-diphosphate-sugar epimerase